MQKVIYRLQNPCRKPIKNNVQRKSIDEINKGEGIINRIDMDGLSTTTPSEYASVYCNPN